MVKKLFFSCFLCLLFLTAIAQAQNLKENIEVIKGKVTNSEGVLKLKWLDSLTTLVEFDEALKYDSIARET